MSKGDWHVASCVLAGLYLRGGPAGICQRSNWPKVLGSLLQAGGPLGSVVGSLGKAGFWHEASVLGAPGVLASAELLVGGNQVLTAACPGYPARWREVLGASAPPALWRCGDVPVSQSVSLVGSRQLTAAQATFARDSGSYVAGLGLSVCSGGAIGADQAGAGGMLLAGGQGRVVEVLPVGLGVGGPRDGICRLSACPPAAEFTTAAAMERNALIYAFSSHTIVVSARWRQGGTWSGAVDCLRRRLSTLLVADWGDDTSAALVRLGRAGGGARAVLLDPAASVAGQLRWGLSQGQVLSQPDLFGYGRVREAATSYVSPLQPGA